MYYHTIVLHLFRPFLRVNIAKSNLSPRQICLKCADSAAQLVATYRRLYGLRRIPMAITHVILASSIVHLMDLDITSAARHLAQSITSLRETTPNHSISRRLLGIIEELIKRWNIEVPAAVEEVLAGPPAEDWTALPPEDLQHDFHTVDSAHTNTYLDSGIYGQAHVSLLTSSLSHAPLKDSYWSPFIDGSNPLQRYTAASQMDNSAVLHQPIDQWQHLDQYGFQFAAHGHQIPRGISVRDYLS